MVMPNQYYVLLTASLEVRDEVQADEAQPGTAPKNVFRSVSSLRCLSRLCSVFNLSHAEVPGVQEIISSV